MSSRNVPDQRTRFDARTPMRDGISLSSDVYLPPTESPAPALVWRTPYDNSAEPMTQMARRFSMQGYAVVLEDVRGRGDSDGRFEPFMNEVDDGYDTVEWIAAQPWCDGKVGMLGASYGGYVQWAAARNRPPHLRALISTAAAGRFMHELPYMSGKIRPDWLLWLNLTGGRTQQQILLKVGDRPLIDWDQVLRTRPLRDADIALGRTNTAWRTWLAHPTMDEYWKPLMLGEDFAGIDLPVLHITGWYDADQWGALHYYDGMMALSPARDKQYLISGPWNHIGTVYPTARLGGVEFGQSAVLSMGAIFVRWFNYWLKGEPNGQESEARARVFVMGRNQWRESPTWPPPSAKQTPIYFHSDGHANGVAGDGRLSRTPPSAEPPDAYTYDPESPTPSDRTTDDLLTGEGSLDQGFLEGRDDMLVYTSETLSEEVEVTGRVHAVLYASSDCTDTDWAAVLTDVYPDGRSIKLSEGVLRASYRDSLEQPAPIEPGRVYALRFELTATSNAFQPGHRIRINVMSCRFPAWDRNPNTGAPPGDDLETRPARQTLHHSAQYPSHLLLPVVPKSE